MRNQLIIITISLLAVFQCAYAVEDNTNCNYQLNDTRQVGASYCHYVKGPDNTNRYTMTQDDGRLDAKPTCVNNDPSSTFDIKLKNYKWTPGVHTTIVYQCDNEQCKNKKIIGTSNFNADNNGVLNNNILGVTLDPTFGETCTPE